MTDPRHIGYSPFHPSPGEDRPVPGHATMVKANDDLRIVTLRDFSDNLISPSDWNGLVSASGGTIYQTFEWNSAWWGTFGRTSHNELNVLLFMTGGRTVGIAPLFREKIPFGNSRRLRFIGSGDAFSHSGGLFLDNGPSDYLDFIVEPEFASSVGGAFLRYLAQTDRNVRTVDLVNLQKSGCVATGILPRLTSAGLTHHVTEGERCPFIPVTMDTGGFIRQLNGSVRRRMNQAWKHLHDGDDLRLRTGTSESDLREIFPELVMMHQRRWNRAGFPGLFMDPGHRRFHEEIALTFLRRGWLWISAAYSDDTCVAARLGFQFNGRIYDYLSGFDDEARAARKRPGMALLLTMYDDARKSGYGTVDMLRGDEEYKFELTNDFHTLSNLRIVPGGPRDQGIRCPGGIRDVFEKTTFLLGREMKLFEVHVRTSGWPACIMTYLRFRAGRLMRKMGKTMAESASNGGSPADR